MIVATLSHAAPATAGSDDRLVEFAILAILSERRELYPLTLRRELRRRVPHLAEAPLRPVLERMWRERRVARLWHRYLLPGDVPAVRACWLAALERQRAAFEQAHGDLRAWTHARALLFRWDGWTGDEVAA